MRFGRPTLRPLAASTVSDPPPTPASGRGFGRRFGGSYHRAKKTLSKFLILNFEFCILNLERNLVRYRSLAVDVRRALIEPELTTHRRT